VCSGSESLTARRSARDVGERFQGYRRRRSAPLPEAGRHVVRDRMRPASASGKHHPPFFFFRKGTYVTPPRGASRAPRETHDERARSLSLRPGFHLGRQRHVLDRVVVNRAEDGDADLDAPAVERHHETNLDDGALRFERTRLVVEASGRPLPGRRTRNRRRGERERSVQKKVQSHPRAHRSRRVDPGLRKTKIKTTQA